MFSAPWDIWSFSFLFVLPDNVVTVAHQFKIFGVSFNENLGLVDRSFFMSLHSHEDQIFFGSIWVFGELFQSVSQKLNILFVAGNDEGKPYILVCWYDLSSFQRIQSLLLFVVWFTCCCHGFVVFSAYNYAVVSAFDSPYHSYEGLGCSNQVDCIDIVPVDYGIEEWSCEHKGPVENVEDW